MKNQGTWSIAKAKKDLEEIAQKWNKAMEENNRTAAQKYGHEYRVAHQKLERLVSWDF